MKSETRCSALLFSVAITLLSGGTILAAEQYKVIGREAIAQVVDGKVDAAIEQMGEYLEENPDDAESMFILAVAHAQKQDIDTAITYVKRAISAGLPFGRFLAGPRELLRPLTESDQFKALAREHGAELVHGPLLGCVADTSARFWVRTANEVPVQVLIGTSKETRSPIKSNTAKTSKDQDYTAVLTVKKLKPATEYHYALLIDGKKQAERFSFRTCPTVGKPARFQIAFGGGAGYTPRHERMWSTIAAHNPAALLLLGDNVYIDNPTRPAVQRYCYYRRQSRPEFRALAASTAVYAIWDDHDFTTNDHWGGPEIRKPRWKIPVWNVFRENWNNPSYAGDSEEQPGCWFDFSIADVDFFMLDCRYYRDDPKQRNPSMLGGAQKKWLFKRLESSKAAFKVLASSVPWAPGAKPGSRDPWDGYKAEREEIFSFLEANKINGVILISADRHRSDLWKIDRPNAYPLYEFESSKLTNIHTHAQMPGAIFSYNENCSFGLLQFDTTAADPRVTFQIVSIDDDLIHTFSLERNRLTHER